MKTTVLLTLFLFATIFANAQAPTITSFSPAGGPPGTLVTITGTNLKGLTSFKIGDTTAIVVSDTALVVANYGDTLLGMVMPGAVTGPVSVTTSGGTATSSVNFNIKTTSYPSVQQGKKLVGTGASGAASQGYAVAISADGNTVIMGGYGDNSDMGAAWIFTRSGLMWSQQGTKLVGIGAVGTSSYQAVAVSISADGNTAMVGAPSDNNGIGASWIFVRNGSGWIQQAKLIGSGAVNVPVGASQGAGVCLSADGNTAIIGGVSDNDGDGAAWIFTRTSGTWTQQGSKLMGSDAAAPADQGNAVSISADGKTAIVGGQQDNYGVGAVWVYTLSGGAWTQQGGKLVGNGASGTASQGSSVAISSDGNTIIEGGPIDSNFVGASWIFTRSGGIWTQQGTKLVGTGAIREPVQGVSVSISADGNTSMIGGYGDHDSTGAVWIFTRSGGVWTQQGSKLTGTGAVGAAQQGSWQMLSADGNTAIVGGPYDNGQTGASWIFVSAETDGIPAIENKKDILSVYPNPNNGVFTIQSPSEGFYSIVNSLGQTVQTFKINAANNYSVNIECLNSGIYFIVGTDGVQTTGQKVVVAK